MPAESPPLFIWVFNGERSTFPGGLFTTLDAAESWIALHQLTGTLTQYPCDTGAYDHPVAAGLFTPKTDVQRSPAFIGRFSSASFEHHHYESGIREV